MGSRLPRFPVQQPAQLCFPKIEDPQRPEWIPSYFPATRPESELTSAAPSNGTGPNGQLTAAVPAIEYETPEHQPQVAPTSPQVPIIEPVYLQHANTYICHYYLQST